MKGEYFGELARLPLEYQPVAESDSTLLDRTAVAPPASGAAELPNCRDWFRVHWQKRILLCVLIFGATITVSTATGLFKPVKVATDEASQRHSTLIAKVENQDTASTAEIEKARQQATADHTELAQLRAQMSDAVRAPSSDAAGLDRQLSELAAAIEKLRQQASADRAAVAQLRTQVSEAARVHAPDAAFDRQLSQLMDLIQKVQQLAATDSTNLIQLVEKLRRAAMDNHAGLARLEKQFGEAFHAPPRPDDTPPSIPQPQESPQFTGTVGTSPDVGLPTDAIPRVILRFARNRDSARTRAATLELSLRTQGMDVVKSEGTPASSRNEIMYFYSQDRSSAERIAAGLAEAALIQRPFADDGSLPPPGTIEVAIGQ